MNKNNTETKARSSSFSGYERIVLWPEYERFRSGYLILLIVFNCLALLTNLGLLIGASFAVTLVPLAVILVIAGTVAALQFVERIAEHFDKEPSVQKVISQAKTGQVPSRQWGKFFQTIDGRLFSLAVLQFAIMAVLFWYRWH